MAIVSTDNIYNVSDFRERIQILQLQQTNDGLGGYKANWIPQKSIWGLIRLIERPDINNTLRQEHIAHYEIISRYNKITVEQRITFRNITAIIKNITELDNRKKFISFTAQTVIN